MCSSDLVMTCVHVVGRRLAEHVLIGLLTADGLLVVLALLLGVYGLPLSYVLGLCYIHGVGPLSLRVGGRLGVDVGGVPLVELSATPDVLNELLGRLGFGDGRCGLRPKPVILGRGRRRASGLGICRRLVSVDGLVDGVGYLVVDGQGFCPVVIEL